jgi:formate hydrogenlyase subunit 3/multisubunit Na+/H+ antiporter MnhD subunit
VSLADTALIGVCVAALAATVAALVVTSPRRRVVVVGVLTATVGAGGFAAGVGVLTTGHPVVARFAAVLPFTGVVVHLDALGALFSAVSGAVIIVTAIYGIGYYQHGLTGRAFQVLLPMFALTLIVVPAAASVATFLVLWELMAITSLLLLMAEHRERDSVRDAAAWYAVMTHLGFVAILLAFVVLGAHAHGQSFAALRDAAVNSSSATRSLVMVMALIGFGSKAGMVPLHVWLPRAHPEAPTPVSALMSAAMVGLGVYGIVRIDFDLLGGGPRWWWIVLMALGAASALFGILHALVSTDLKRLLAYSTTENIGLVLIGVGASGIFASTGHPVLAATAMAAAMFHLVNHAAFKALLFLGAGSIVHATGVRDLDRLGGLMRRMPITGATFAVGAFAIAALPPLNGFVGEWLLLQTLVRGVQSQIVVVALMLILAVGAIALTAGLAAATFVKALGTGFLALPRSEEATGAVESPRVMGASMITLAVVCVVLGLVPGIVVGPLGRVVTAAGVRVGRDPFAVHGWKLTLPGGSASISTAILGCALVGAVLVVLVTRRLVSRTARRRAENWGCGRVHQTARMEYTASSFAEPLMRVFDDVLRPDLDVDVTHREESRYYLEAVRLHGGVTDAFEQHLYRPVIGAVMGFGRWARRLQNGSVHRYLAYGLVTLVILLVVAR